MGRDTTASGNGATAMGREIEAQGDYSVAIALNDQNGAVVSQPNTMAIVGGKVGIGTLNPESALQVSGYTQIDVLASAPPSADCNAESEAGRMKFDTTNDILYICSGASGWISK